MLGRATILVVVVVVVVVEADGLGVADADIAKHERLIRLENADCTEHGRKQGATEKRVAGQRGLYTTA
jgi:hypothetical protein